jgi:hypothetical protein
MRKGTVIHLDSGETLPHQELAMADLVINGSVIVKNRYGSNGARILNPCSGASGPLDRGIFRDWEIANHFAATFDERVNSRITEILDIVHAVFGENTDDYNWYFDGAEEGQMGTIHLPDDDESQISYVYENENKYSKKKFLETTEWDYTLGIPKKFLFMNDDEITKYIEKQIERCSKKDAQKKAKREASKKEKEQKKKELLNRLSSEEKKLLGIKK